MEKKQQLFKLFESENKDSCETTTATDNSAAIPDLESTTREKTPKMKIFDIRQILTGWLLQQNPTGIGVSVPTRISRYQADIAAFWSVPVDKLLTPQQTMIIEIRHDREACWPDCADKDKLLELLREAKNIKTELEERIKRDEPELVDTNVLFEEYRGWNYHESKNSYYHEICRKIEKIEHAIYKGSRFEMIRSGQVADLLYLAVPKESVTPTEVADGWGLLYFDECGEVTEIKSPDNWNCSMKKRQHLIQNIAAINSKDTLFRNGINQNFADNSITFSKAPRRRRSFR
jgi:hypothetical protein